MADVVLSEKLLAGLAGWEVVKQTRVIAAENRVLSSNWSPPVLRGVVQSGTTSYRAGLIIRRENDAENLCTCRPSREWGTLCAHSVAVGIHAIRRANGEDAEKGRQPAASQGVPPGAPARSTPPGPPRRRASSEGRRLRRAGPSEPGEPLEIHVILPPNFAEGAARGRLMLFLEGRWKNGQAPLASLPFAQPFHLDERDEDLLDALEELAGGETPSMAQLGAADLSQILSRLAGHPRVSVGRQSPIEIPQEPWRVPLRATLQPTGEITLQTRPEARGWALLPGEPSWALGPGGIRRVELPRECHKVFESVVRWTRQQVPAFVSATLPALQAATDLEANFSPEDFEFAPQRPRFLLHLAGGMATLAARLQCAYGPRVMTLGATSSDEAVWLPDPENPRRYSTRDLQAEAEALERLRRPGFSGPDAQGQFHLHGQNRVLTFFARDFARIQREWEVTLEERLERSAERHLERVETSFTITPSGEQWFDLQVSFTAGGERLPLAEIQRLLRGGQSFTRTKNGKYAILDTGAVEELEQILVDCAPQQHAGGYRIRANQAGFVDATLREQGWEAKAPPAWRERARQMEGAVDLPCPDLGPLESVLRPYQKHGVAWMDFLRRNEFGGVLADEMGLGKTLQALALLAANRRARGNGQGQPNLVVCPTSLVFNWVAEAARFVPEFRVVALHGPKRHELFARVPECDLAVTSYALIRRDLERLRGIEFDTVILDEAQHIKNRQTQNAQAVKAVRSRRRLILTGTPLENSVLDLWSLFDFLMSGYLGSAQDFRDRYEIPIARMKDRAAQERLARRVRPFLLRRLKRDVAPELPPRIDQVVWCDLTEEQAAVYQQLLTATRQEVTAAVGAQGLAKSRMIVLTALLRLRQACCDLRLLGVPDNSDGSGEAEGSDDSRETPRQGSDSAADTSGKLAAFGELLEEVIDGGHRVLVFSQFTRMLGLLKERLRKDGVEFCYLDGSTRDRQGEIRKFQGSARIPVFLISLKAGGVGLNLTGADTVVHFDPWWNPAVEDQATDRAHRMGQKRVVTSYKLITRGTVEEKILNLQQRKREVLQGVLQGEEQLAEALTWEEIQDLVAG